MPGRDRRLSGARVEITGLRELLRDARRMGNKDVPREVRRALRGAVKPIAADAARRAPRGQRSRARQKYKRHLNTSIRPFAQGDVAGIRSSAPHAPIVHWGGRRPADTRNREKWIDVQGRPFITEAVDAASGRLVDAVADAVDRAASMNGWR